MFCKKSVLKNFPKFTGKHLCQSLGPTALLKKRLWHRCVLRTPLFRTPMVAASDVTKIAQTHGHTFHNNIFAFKYRKYCFQASKITNKIARQIKCYTKNTVTNIKTKS